MKTVLMKDRKKVIDSNSLIDEVGRVAGEYILGCAMSW
jgi:hypothetical protein